MSWYNDYKRSLKNIEAEEPLDVYFYRPLAFVIVKLFYRLPFTPNHYSVAALISGLLSSFYFYQGNLESFKLGALYFFLFAVLDCCDGMVARLKKNGTEFGRLIDGLVDYTVNAAVYFSLAYGVKKYYHNELIEPWVLVIAAGISKALHSIIYDHYLNEYMSYANGKTGFTELEIIKYSEKLEIAKKENAFIKVFALNIYLGYTKLQAGKEQKAKVHDAKAYLEQNLLTLKLWSVIGPACHIAVLIIAFLFNSPNVLFIYAIIFGNLFLAFMLLVQLKINSETIAQKVH